jgi:hypothetical protein
MCNETNFRNLIFFVPTYKHADLKKSLPAIKDLGRRTNMLSRKDMCVFFLSIRSTYVHRYLIL